MDYRECSTDLSETDDMRALSFFPRQRAIIAHILFDLCHLS